MKSPETCHKSRSRVEPRYQSLTKFWIDVKFFEAEDIGAKCLNLAKKHIPSSETPHVLCATTTCHPTGSSPSCSATTGTFAKPS